MVYYRGFVYRDILIFDKELMNTLVSHDSSTELLVKSSERVRDLGEVFTPKGTVKDILDLLPESVWSVHPSPAFLEPSCGDGNFLVAILERKLAEINTAYEAKDLLAGVTSESAQFHALEALASIYAVDLSIENVIGGTPGHEIGARSRLVALFKKWNMEVLSKKLVDRSLVLRAAEWIVEHNVLVGNMLPVDSNGKPTGRDRIPLIEYVFEPSNQTVELLKTTMGDVIKEEEQKNASIQQLFGPVPPVKLWRGKAFNIAESDRVVAPTLNGPARNGLRRN